MWIDCAFYVAELDADDVDYQEFNTVTNALVADDLIKNSCEKGLKLVELNVISHLLCKGIIATDGNIQHSLCRQYTKNIMQNHITRHCCIIIAADAMIIENFFSCLTLLGKLTYII